MRPPERWRPGSRTPAGPSATRMGPQCLRTAGSLSRPRKGTRWSSSRHASPRASVHSRPTSVPNGSSSRLTPATWPGRGGSAPRGIGACPQWTTRGPLPTSGGDHAGSPDGKTMALAGDGFVALYSVGDWKALPRSADPPSPVYLVRVTDDGKRVSVRRQAGDMAGRRRARDGNG